MWPTFAITRDTPMTWPTFDCSRNFIHFQNVVFVQIDDVTQSSVNQGD
jgi:hypothetical protein